MWSGYPCHSSLVLGSCFAPYQVVTRWWHPTCLFSPVFLRSIKSSIKEGDHGGTANRDIFGGTPGEMIIIINNNKSNNVGGGKMKGKRRWLSNQFSKSCFSYGPFWMEKSIIWPFIPSQVKLSSVTAYSAPYECRVVITPIGFTIDLKYTFINYI